MLKIVKNHQISMTGQTYILEKTVAEHLAGVPLLAGSEKLMIHSWKGPIQLMKSRNFTSLGSLVGWVRKADDTFMKRSNSIDELQEFYQYLKDSQFTSSKNEMVNAGNCQKPLNINDGPNIYISPTSFFFLNSRPETSCLKQIHS